MIEVQPPGEGAPAEGLPALSMAKPVVTPGEPLRLEIEAFVAGDCGGWRGGGDRGAGAGCAGAGAGDSGGDRGACCAPRARLTTCGGAGAALRAGVMLRVRWGVSPVYAGLLSVEGLRVLRVVVPTSQNRDMGHPLCLPVGESGCGGFGSYAFEAMHGGGDPAAMTRGL